MAFNLSAKNKVKYIFKNNTEGYKVYRIPVVVGTKSGKLLAFCEGRQSLMDGGNIDLVMKQSTDGGVTWSVLSVIWNDRNNTCGNPAVVVDKTSGNIIIAATLNNNKVYVLISADEGKTWQPPFDITDSVKSVSWQWYATGPVHAIQINTPPYTNRIVVPCNHTVKGSSIHISHTIYSDDGGSTWHIGGSVPTQKTDECTVAELSNGQLLLNMRNNDRTLPNRKISYSKDGGNTWSESIYDSTLIEPICQGALLQYQALSDTILFTNPSNKKKRKNLTLHISFDNGNTWSKKMTLYASKSAYNDMVIGANNNLICLFETGMVLPYSGIALISIPVQELFK